MGSPSRSAAITWSHTNSSSVDTNPREASWQRLNPHRLLPVSEPSSKLFVRNATGLVRGVPSKSSIIINFIPGHPTQTLAAVFFFALTLAPGGNVYLGILLVLPMTLAFSYAFGLLTSMIPRSGGDYVLVSRVIHPVGGLMSSFCLTMAGLLSNAFFGLAFVTVGLGPGLTGIGLIGHNTRLIKWGTTLSSSHKWQFIFGGLMMVAAGLIMTGGWRRVLRIQNTLFWMVTGSLLLCVVVAIFTTHSTFVHNFNNFARPYTHSGNTYAGVIAAATKAGVMTHAPSRSRARFRSSASWRQPRSTATGRRSSVESSARARAAAPPTTWRSGGRCAW